MPTARIVLLDAEDEAGATGLHEDDVRRCVPDLECIETLRLRRDRKPPVERRDGVRQPVHWQALGSALKRLLGEVREARGRDPAAVTIIAGVGPLPMFSVAGFELQRVWPLVLVNRRQREPVPDVLTFDDTAAAAPTQASGPRVFFDGVSLPRDRSEARGLVALGVSTGAPIERDQMQAFARDIGLELAGVAHLHKAEPHAGLAPLTLKAGNALLAAAQLYDTLRAVHELFPRRSAIALFIRGPAPLAFLAGRAVSGGVPGRILLPQCREERDGYDPAFELRGPRAGSDYACLPQAELPSPLRPRRPRASLLYFSASPTQRRGRRHPFDEEPRAIRQIIEAATQRRGLRLIPHVATRIDDLLQALNRHRPSVVHFGCHGLTTGLVLQRNANAPTLLSAGPLVKLLAACKPVPRLVVLNACGSAAYADEVAQVVECVVGMPERLEEQAALDFARAFYDALASAHSVQTAYDQARALLEAHGRTAQPKLRVRPGVDASCVTLVAGTAAALQENR